MDRDDARFVACALASRIAGDTEAVECLAASSLMRLSALATRIRKLADDWAPALCAVDELMAICRRGGGICDEPADPRLQIFVDKMNALAAEPPAPVRNRADRRARAARLPRAARRDRLVVPSERIIH
jgi:hypothetical protein